MPKQAKYDQDVKSPFQRDGVRNQKREYIIRVASDFFNKKGFEATSLDEVAERIGISKPSVYYYCNNKSELLLECYTRTLDVCESLLKEAQALHGSGMDQLCAFTRELIISHCTSGAVAIVNEVESLPREAIGPIKARSTALTRDLELLVEAGIADGSVRADLAPITIRFLMGGVNWIAKWHRDTGPLGPDEIADAFIDFMRNGAGVAPS